MNNILLTALFAFSLFALPSLASAETSPRMCTMQYNPVCGLKAGVYVTYGNSCMMDAEASFVHEGECTDKEEFSNPPEKDETYIPPKGCTAWFDGCNSCSTGPNGQTACTLKACIGKPAAGYCTAYESSPKPTPAPQPGVSVGTGTSGSATASSGSDGVDGTAAVETNVAVSTPKANIFVRTWTSIATWFGGLF